MYSPICTLQSLFSSLCSGSELKEVKGAGAAAVGSTAVGSTALGPTAVGWFLTAAGFDLSAV